jgi:hypothetical protein
MAQSMVKAHPNSVGPSGNLNVRDQIYSIFSSNAPPVHTSGHEEASRRPRRHGRSTSHTGQNRCSAEDFSLVPSD